MGKDKPVSAASKRKPGGKNYKVLMALMALDIGGAETHVLELSKALAGRGITVYVVSNGGAYESELAKAGIKHFKAPLHTKHPGSMLQSYRILRKIIIENDIKLVHAHARIPAFLCGLLKKRLGFRLATTAHWVFSTAFPYKMLADWGERSLAVSADIKEYLITKYNIPAEHIFVTVNGIDTDRLSPAVRAKYKKSVAGDDKPLTILITGRLDKSRSLITRHLVESAEKIYAFNPRTEIISVGSGDDFDEIKSRADAVNKKLGTQFIKLPGKTVGIEKYLAQADIFVGPSRSAMEAMSMGIPIVLAGNEGYLGIFDGSESKLKAAVDTNFCFRGCGDTTAQKLSDDVIRLMAMPPEEREALGALGRDLITSLYSAGRMADDAIDMYESLRIPAKKTDVLIMGYYGNRNNGDDMLLKAIIDSLRAERPGIGIEVVSMRPKETEAIYGVKSIHKLNIPGILKKLRETRLFLLGGGTLIQDLTSSRSLFYYLFAINSAVKRGARTMLFSNGIGPILRTKNIPKVKSALNKVDLITLREPTSADILKTLGVTKPPVRVTADIVFSLRLTDPESGAQKLIEMGMDTMQKKYFCVSIRQWKNLAADFEQSIAACVEHVAKEHGITPVFILMHPDVDGDITHRVRGMIKAETFVLDTSCGLDEMLGVVGGSVFVLGMRLHAIIYAAMFGVPSIGLVYDPKVQAFLDMINQKYYSDVSVLKAEEIIGFADDLINNRDRISADITDSVRVIKEKAIKNTGMALDLFDKYEF